MYGILGCWVVGPRSMKTCVQHQIHLERDWIPSVLSTRMIGTFKPPTCTCICNGGQLATLQGVMSGNSSTPLNAPGGKGGGGGGKISSNEDCCTPKLY